MDYPSQSIRSTAIAGWCALALLLALAVPLFLCMPVTADVAMYDLQADSLMHGAVLYRDIFEPNLPGAVWLHIIVRSLLGKSSEAIRGADLFLFGAIVLLLVRWIRSSGRPLAVQAWTSVACVMFYFSLTEWCHCQRDMWLLLPALAALHLRRHQLQRLVGEGSPAGKSLAWAALEGLCWGAGVWLKPMIIIPAAATWIVSAAIVRRRRPVLIDFCGLLMGGLLAGSAGILWLYGTGAWPHFLETLIQWNPVYFAAGRERWAASQVVEMGKRLFPWSLLHFVAVPVALHQLIYGLGNIRNAGKPGYNASGIVAPMFAVFYFGWLVQAVFLQHLFDYVHAPGILLALAIVAAAPPLLRDERMNRAVVAEFLVVALCFSPIWRPDRVACWLTCVAHGSTPEIKQKLARWDGRHWQDIERVAQYLEHQHLKDGELTCYDSYLVHLYKKLGLRPSTKFIYLKLMLDYFPKYRDTILQSVVHSQQQYVVSDLSLMHLPSYQLEAVATDQLSLPRGFPWDYPVVFRSGTMLVHRVPPDAKLSASPPLATIQSAGKHSTPAKGSVTSISASLSH